MTLYRACARSDCIASKGRGNKQGDQYTYCNSSSRYAPLKWTLFSPQYASLPRTSRCSSSVLSESSTFQCSVFRCVSPPDRQTFVQIHFHPKSDFLHQSDVWARLLRAASVAVAKALKKHLKTDRNACKCLIVKKNE